MMQGKSRAGAADSREWEHGARTDGQPAGERGGRPRFRNIRLHRQFAPVLVGITLLCTLGLTGLAYAGARSYAISGAEAQALRDIQVERQLVVPRGSTLQLQDGRLVLTSAGAPLVLNNDTTLVDETRSLTGDAASIYQAEGSRLVAVSTNIPAADARGAPLPGSRALGDALTGSAFASLQGGCGASSPASCHETYQGTITVAGVSYAAAIAPLYDAGGVYVGALGIAEPVATATAPAVQLAVMLLIAGLLFALLSLVVGFWFFGSAAQRSLGALDLRLRHVGDAASELERLAQLQSSRAARQDRVAQQVSEQARALDAMTEIMEQGRASLHDASGDIWAEMSHPGFAPDPATALRLAQQAAISAAQVGSAAQDARDVSGQLVGLMNHIIAEGAIIGDGGLEMEARAQDLRVAVESVEMTVGERLLRRTLFLRRVRAASQRVRRFLPAPFSRGLASEGAGRDEPDDESPRPVTEPHPMAQWSWAAPEPERRPAAGQYPTPRGVAPQPRRPQPGQPPARRQQQAPRTPPRLIRTGELPPVLPPDRPGSGYLGERPGSGLLSRRDAAEPSLPRGDRPPRDNWRPGDSRQSGWLGEHDD